MSKDFALILTAAGKSERFNNGEKGAKKEYSLINGKSIVRMALDAFLPLPELRRVVITVPKGGEKEMKTSLGEVDSEIPIAFIEGGPSRTQSISHAMEYLSSFSDYSLIAIHDGARPFIDRDTICNCLYAADSYGGAIPGIRVADAMKRADEEAFIVSSVDRNGVWRIQTPQIFQRDKILSIYSTLKEDESFDDDASLFSSRGGRVKIVEGNEDNIKITWKDDLKRNKSNMRIGFGNDIHRLEEGRKLYIGGVLLDHTKGEVAHSDGDVLIHAVIDAILGAKAMGDIGTYFPTEAKKWKDADSKELLKVILDKTKPSIINIDATITLEGFKLNPRILDIRRSLAELLSTSIDKVSIKAKTNEGLDALGKGDAIKAEVVVLLAD